MAAIDDSEMEVMEEGDEYDEEDEDDSYHTEDVEDDDTPDPNLYRFVKRRPQHLTSKRNDVYVSRRSHFVAQYKHIRDLLDDNREDEVVIHGLGAAMNTAVKLALLVKEKSGGMYELSPTTATVALLDDYEPLTESLSPITLVRYNSAIHIRVRRKPNTNTKTTQPMSTTPTLVVPSAPATTNTATTSTSASTPSTSSKKRKSRKSKK